MPVLASGFNPEMWRGLHAIEISAFWKERHAKGTPVKMEYQQWKQIILTTPHIQNTNRRHNHNEVWVECKGDDDVVVATFCNFRYKEKGGENV